MVPLTSLLVPIVLSAILVFVVSAIIHMVLPYHRTDYAPVPQQDSVMAAMRPFAIPPGEYIMPYGGTPAAMKDPVFQEKVKAGPVAFMTVMPNEMGGMGKQLGLWFLYSVIVGLFAAYVAGRALGPGAEYMEVFRLTSTVAFVGYTVANWQNSIWYRRKWSTSLKNTIDGLIYALLTGGVFGWLWPA